MPYRAKAVEAALVGTEGTAEDDRGGRGARDRRRHRQRRHPRRQRVPNGDGGRVHAAGDRGGARPARLTRRRAASDRRVRLERLTPGRRPPAELAGAVLARDSSSAASAGRRAGGCPRPTSTALGAPSADGRRGPVTVIVLEPGDLHEDDAALRLAAAVAGPGLDRAARSRAGSISWRRTTACSTSGSPSSSG